MSDRDRIHRRLVRLLLEECGYAAVVRLLEEESETAPRPRRRRVLSHDERAKRAVDELARERARRIVGDD